MEQLDQTLAAIAAADTPDAVETLRVAALGKQGWVSALLKTLGGMTPDQRQVEGPRIHAAREAVTAALLARKADLESAVLEARLASERVDLTLPAADALRGSIHPVSQVMDELAEIFADLGFAVASGPEIEDDWHNFTALNMPETHPARAMHDTFYFPDRDEAGRSMLLRTHTSPVQIRAMLAQGAPLRIIAPGRVYRSDSDATHTPMFERDDIVLRLRPSYFPFTEPSVEVDVGFTPVNGKRVVGGDGDAPGGGWMEVLGSGMISRHVLAAGGLDPDEWQGFAFGTGVDRLAMLKYGMDDLRPFFDGDARWLAHYGFAALDVPTLSGGVGVRP